MESSSSCRASRRRTTRRHPEATFGVKNRFHRASYRPRANRIALALLTVAWLAFGEPAGAVPSGEGTPIHIQIHSPRPGEAVANKVHQAPIRGNATADGSEPLQYDIVIAIDLSGSTQEASGTDVDGDGEVGFNPQNELVPDGMYPDDLLSTDPGDTILAAEVAAARALIASLEPGRVRIGIVSFAGEVNPQTGLRLRYDQRDAWVEVPLTSDFYYVHGALDKILARGPNGATNFAAAIRASITELVGLTGAKSTVRADAKKLILFLTDGTPSFPFGKGTSTDAGDIEAALNAARLAHKAGITINTYAIGPLALTNPIAVTEMARITVGTFMPVRDPGQIVAFLQAISFANVDDIVFTNLTTREVSTDVSLFPDGNFEGFVPVREGNNRVRVTALASDGRSESIEFDMTFETAGLSGRELTIELKRIRERNKQLLLLIESDRIQRFRDQQRKALEFEIEN